MDERATHAVTKIDSSTSTVQPIRASATHRDLDGRPDATPKNSPQPEPALDAHRPTDLSFQIDEASQRLMITVVDRETQSVVRSYSLVLPGISARQDDGAPRGAIVDAKA